jgi:hypothetical protein
VLELSLFLIALSLISAYAKEEHPEFESVEASKRRALDSDTSQDEPTMETVDE